MSALPAPLLELVERYRDLLFQLDSGNLDLDSAYSVLASMAVTDASGARWTVSPDHEPDDAVFLRQDPAGGPAVPTPSDLFVDTAPQPESSAGSRLDRDEWTDDLDDLLTPPVIPHAGPHLFPDDVRLGEPADTGWDHPTPHHPQTSTSPWDHVASSAGRAGAKTPARAGIAILSTVADVMDGLFRRFRRIPPARQRTIIVAIACALAVIAVAVFRDGGQPESSPKPNLFQYTCPNPSIPVAGLSGEASELFGCLDNLPNDPGPGVAAIGVASDGAGNVTFQPDRQITVADAVVTAVRLYAFASGPAPQTSTPIDLSTIAPDQAADIQAAADLGLIDPSLVQALPNPVSRRDQAVFLYRALSRAGVINDAPGGSGPSDTPAGDTEASTAVASLRQAGMVDGSLTDPFRFVDPVLVSEWTIWAGRAAHEIRKPGSMAQRLTSLAARGTDSRPPAPGGPDAVTPNTKTPDPNRVTEVLTALVSGDTTLASGVLRDAGDENTVIERTATWAGFAQLGLRVGPEGPAAPDGSGAVQRLVVTDTDGRTKLTYRVQWVLVDGVWKLRSWPSR